jgi:hypothetical protein
MTAGQKKMTAVLLGLCLVLASALALRPRVPAAPSLLTLSGGEVDAVRRAASSLKSSTAALGAATLAVLSGDLGAAARHAHDALPAPAPLEVKPVRGERAAPPEPDRSH